MNSIDKSLPDGFKTLLDPPIDDLITTDEWNHARYVIRKTLRTCQDEEINKFFEPGMIPFLGWFERAIENRLIKAGFDKESIKNEIWFKGLMYTLDFEQGFIYSGRWDLNPPFGFPAGTYTLSDDNHQMWIKPEIEAALVTLQTLKKLDELLVKDGKVNIEALRVFLHSFELTINLSRTGLLPEKALRGEKYSKSQGKIRKKRQTWGGLKRDQLLARNQRICEDFKKTGLTENNFSNKYAGKYDLKPRRIREILKMIVGN